jgi:hypothetical protein
VPAAFKANTSGLKAKPVSLRPAPVPTAKGLQMQQDKQKKPTAKKPAIDLEKWSRDDLLQLCIKKKIAGLKSRTTKRDLLHLLRTRDHK